MALCIPVLSLLLAATADLKQALETVRAVGPDGKGSAAAACAWQELAAAGIDQLPELLAGMDGASPLARNWLRAAVDQVLAGARAAKKPVPAAALEAFLKDARHDPQARRLAYELILEADPTAANRFLPAMLDDPSPELRRDAVARALDQAEKRAAAEPKGDAKPLFRQALAAGRDRDQIDKAARRLRDLGEPVDLAAQLGMILDWQLIGPFPNDDGKGVETAYPPEKEINFNAAYDGKEGKVRWVDYVSKDEYGIVDVNVGLGQHLNVVAYAATAFTSKEARDVDIRLGCFTVFKLWVNGALVLARGDAYTGMRLDHYVAKARLKPGKNVILLKVCQAEPPPQLPKHWRFQLRVCDAGGKSILSATRPVAPPPDKKSS